MHSSGLFPVCFLICLHLHMLLHLPLKFEGLGKDIKSIYMEKLGEVVPLFYILPTITKIFICESSVCVERDETTTGIHQQVNFIKPENIGKLGNEELDQHRLGMVRCSSIKLAAIWYSI